MIATDLDELIPLIERNIEENKHLISGNLKAQALRWEDDVSHLKEPQLILASDCLYYDKVRNLRKNMCK